MGRAVLVSLVLALVLCVGLGAVPVGIVVDAGKDSVTLSLAPGWYRAVLDTGALYDFSETMPWALHGEAYNDVNAATIYAVAADDSQEYVGEIELWRQSERVLWERYGFEQEAGYILVGRCSFDLSEPCGTTYGTRSMSELTTAEQAEIRDLFPSLTLSTAVENQAPATALTNAIAVHNALAPYLDNNGPSSVWSGSHTPSECFDLVINDGAPVMCGMAQTLYAYLAISSRRFAACDVTACNLYRYEAIDGIVVNGHSVIELDTSAGPFMWDPFAGVYVTDATGALSAEEIRTHWRAGTIGSVTVHQSAAAWEQDFTADPADYNYWCHFNAIDRLALTGVGLSPQTFTVGSAPTDRAGNISCCQTVLDKANPSTVSGTISSVEFYTAQAITGCKVGTFYGSGTSWTLRDYEAIGSVAAGSSTVSGLSITVQPGDIIGVYFTTGALDASTTGGVGVLYKAGDQFVSGAVTYALASGYAISVRGGGTQ